MSVSQTVNTKYQSPQVKPTSLPVRGAMATRSPASSAALSAALEAQTLEHSTGAQTENRETRAQASRRRKRERQQRRLEQQREETCFRPLPTLVSMRQISERQHTYLSSFGLAPFFLEPVARWYARGERRDASPGSSSEDWETFQAWSQALQAEMHEPASEHVSIEIGHEELMRQLSKRAGGRQQ